MTAQATDLATIAHLDFAPPCAAPHCRSGRPPAKWLVRFVCGCTYPSCKPCKKSLSTVLDAVGRFTCLACGAEFHGRLGAFCTIERLPVNRDEYLIEVARAMREDELQEQIRLLAVHLGWLYYHTHRSQHSPAGFPDGVMVRGPRLIFEESKRHGKQPTAAQEMWLGKLAAAGNQGELFEVYVWRPLDLLTGEIARILT